MTVRAQRELLIAPLVTYEDVENVALQPLERDLERFERPLCAEFSKYRSEVRTSQRNDEHWLEFEQGMVR